MTTGSTVQDGTIEIWTEGKTDWKILKKAQEKLGIRLPISFHEYENEMGDRSLLNRCKTFSEKSNKLPLVFIFDRDNKDIIPEISGPSTVYRNWGNNVFSFPIPAPSHRDGYLNISIEFYFTDSNIITLDKHNRRLFLTSEFNEKSGKYKENPKINIGNKGQLQGYTEPLKAKVIDTEVYDESDKNIALTKVAFANYIYHGIPPFNEFSFQEFRRIFDIIEQIAIASQPKIDICIPDIEQCFERRDGKDIIQELGNLYETIYNVLSLALQIFIITTIRIYEDVIVSEHGNYRKKVNRIKKILADDFFAPTFTHVSRLAEACYYLVDLKAPKDLQEMKESLGKIIVLGDIGNFVDNLEKLFPPPAGSPILINKPTLKKNIIGYLLMELAKYGDHQRDELEKKLAVTGEIRETTIDIWINALKAITADLKPIFSHAFVFKTIEKLDPKTGQYILSVKKYYKGVQETSQITVPTESADDDNLNVSELLLSDEKSIRLEPFLLIKEESLYFYRRTRAYGYEYYSIAGNRVFIKETKRKFNYAIFKTGSKQHLFWTEVMPTTSDINGIKANIPNEDLKDFVGRRGKINEIRENIIEIPNQNGIIYGPGGIGKTALMCQISKELLEEQDRAKVIYDNVIWVSAKSDYYDFIFNSIQKLEAKVQSIGGILSAILRFFDFDNLEEYNVDELRELVLEVFKENKILLIVDNFETIPQTEATKIIRFFDIDVKRALRAKPDYFKLIITSRKQIPCGFHQIELDGLDLIDSKRLIKNLYERYKPSAEKLSVEREEFLHTVTKGIPIVIKHCFARIYHYNESFDLVMRSLGLYSNELIQFSFKEILQQVEKKEKDQVQLRVLLLLESINYPLMIRQMADILEIDVYVMESYIPTLVDYQCLKRINEGDQEKYALNDEIRILTRALSQQHEDLIRNIRQRIMTNFSIAKQMDYTQQELQIIGIFEKYLAEKDYLQAEDFINAQLKANPKSIIMNFHYARYLREYKRDINRAIDILEEIREASGNHPNILRLLVSYYSIKDVPNYDRANVYANELERMADGDDELTLGVAEFYVKWSTSLTVGDKCLDPLEDIKRQGNCKELSRKAIILLNKIRNKSHVAYYLLAISHVNLRDHKAALGMINAAMKKSPKDLVFGSYENLRYSILRKLKLI